MKCHLLILLLVLSVAPIVGCNQPTTVTDYASFVRNLNKSGATVEPKGNTEHPSFSELFSGVEKLIKLDGENLGIWEYSNEATAKAEAKFVKFDGFDIYRPPDSESEGLAFHVDWIAPPHWYEKGRIIVLYVGRNQKTLDMLENLLGTQFAGM